MKTQTRSADSSETPVKQTSLKLPVFVLALDGPKCGTFGGAYGTELAAYCELVSQLGFEKDDAALALIEAGNLDTLQELLEDSTDGLTTWTIEAETIQSPIADELLTALEALLKATAYCNFPQSDEVGKLAYDAIHNARTNSCPLVSIRG